MAQATKRTSVVLGALAVIFILIIVILCIVPSGGPPSEHQQAKTIQVTDVLTDDPTTTTTTTTTTLRPPPPTTTITTTTTTTPTTSTTPETIDLTTPTTTTATDTDTTTPTTTTPPPTTTTTTTTTTESTDYYDITSHTNATTTPTTTDTTTTTDSNDTYTTSTTTTITTTTDYSYDTNGTTSTTTATTTTIIDYHDSNDTISTTTSDDYDTNTTTTPSTEEDMNATITTTITTEEDNSTLTTEEYTNVTSTTVEDDMNTTTTTTYEEYMNTTSTTTTTTTEEEYMNTTTTTTYEEDMNTTSTTATPTTTTTTIPLSTNITDTCPTTPICKTAACKMVAANMLAMKDHREDINPCEDFYQYACGGMMQNPFLGARNPRVIANKLVREQLETTDPDETDVGKMREYYDSCLAAVDQGGADFNESLKDVLQVLGYGASVPNTPLNLTHILAQMMLRDFAPFFDVGLDVNREDVHAFSVSLHPVVPGFPGSPFSEDLARKVCLEEHHRRLENLDHTNSYNVEDEYRTFMNCVRVGDGIDARVERMEEAVQRFGLVRHFGAPEDSVPRDVKLKAKTFLDELYGRLPSVAKLKEDFTYKHYVAKRIDELDYRVVEWGKLLQTLMDRVFSTEKVQVYLGDHIDAVLQVIHEYNQNNTSELRQILLMLWSEELYTDFVKPLGRSSVGDRDYCLNAALTLMPEVASRLYMDSLSAHELDARKTQINSVVSAVKRAGRKEFERRGLPGMEVEKLEMMEVVMASEDISDTSVEEVHLNSHRFFKNSVQLQRNRRKLYYSIQSYDPREEWPMFMHPFRPEGVHVEALNSIMVPFAAQDASDTFQSLPQYLTYAGVGHLISHLTMLQLNGTGSDHLGDTKTGLEQQYTATQNYTTHTGLTAEIKMSSLALTDLLADSGATRLAWEAYVMRNDPDPTSRPINKTTYTSSAARRRRSLLEVMGRDKREASGVSLPSTDSEEPPLPWLGLSPIQLYFLHWAQGHCSATAGMSLLDLTESVQTPAKMRVNLVLQNEPLFNKAFQCTRNTVETPYIIG